MANISFDMILYNYLYFCVINLLFLHFSTVLNLKLSPVVFEYERLNFNDINVLRDCHSNEKHYQYAHMYCTYVRQYIIDVETSHTYI